MFGVIARLWKYGFVGKLGAVLAVVLTWVITSTIARVLFTMGVGFFTYRGLKHLIEKVIDDIVPHLNELPVEVLQLLKLANVDQGLTVIFSAVLTYAAFKSVLVFVGSK